MTPEAVRAGSPARTMRPAAVAALVAGAALVVKVVVILLTHNGAPEVLTTVLYLIGVFLPIVVAIDVARGRRSVAAKIAVGVAIVVAQLFYVMMLSDAVEGLVAPFTNTAYVLDEVPIAVLGVIWLAIGGRLLRDES